MKVCLILSRDIYDLQVLEKCFLALLLDCEQIKSCQDGRYSTGTLNNYPVFWHLHYTLTILPPKDAEIDCVEVIVFLLPILDCSSGRS